MKGKFCPDTVLVPCLQYMSNAIELSSTYKIIKPHIFDILTKVYDWFCNAKLIIFMCVHVCCFCCNAVFFFSGGFPAPMPNR